MEAAPPLRPAAWLGLADSQSEGQPSAANALKLGTKHVNDGYLQGFWLLRRKIDLPYIVWYQVGRKKYFINGLD